VTNPTSAKHVHHALPHFHTIAENETMQQDGWDQVKCNITAIDADCQHSFIRL